MLPFCRHAIRHYNRAVSTITPFACVSPLQSFLFSSHHYRRFSSSSAAPSPSVITVTNTQIHSNLTVTNSTTIPANVTLPTTPVLMDGRAIADEMIADMKNIVLEIQQRYMGITPGLAGNCYYTISSLLVSGLLIHQLLFSLNVLLYCAVICIGNRRDSERYIETKHQTATYIGFLSEQRILPESVELNEVINVIEQLNQDPRVQSIPYLISNCFILFALLITLGVRLFVFSKFNVLLFHSIVVVCCIVLDSWYINPITFTRTFTST